MSRTKESTQIPSPVECFIFFNGNTGKFGRPIEDNTNMADLSLPFHFIVLDDGAFRVGGETRASGVKRKIKSNLAHRDYSKHLIVTYSDNGALIAEGEWSEIGTRVKDIGGKYTAVLYVLTKMDEMNRIAALHLRGRALSEWYKFTKGKNPTGPVYFSVKQTKKTEGEDIDSWVPVFEEFALPGQSEEEANSADVILQNWLQSYFANPESIPTATQSRSEPAAQPLSNAFHVAVPASTDDPWAGITDPGAGDIDELPF